MNATPHKHACAQTQQGFQVYLQEVVDGGDRMQHDGDKKHIQTDAGQQERPFGKTRQHREGRRRGDNNHSRIKHYRRTEGESREGLTVLVAGLSKGLSFGENDGNSQILEG